MEAFKNIKTIQTEILTDKILSDYEKQRKRFTFFPKKNEYRQLLISKISTLQQVGLCRGFYENEELKGFIAGYPMKQLFGTVKGVYIPLFGHSVFSENETERKVIYQTMYTLASAEWVKQGYLSHTITLYSKDTTDVNTWFWLGFGNRCVDSIRSCVPEELADDNITVKKATVNDLESITHLEEKNHLYFRKAPLFMPVEYTPSLEALQEWFSKENRHLWIAYEGNDPVGFMRVQSEGESFISHHNSIMNVTGAYVIPKKRGKNVATSLLNEIQLWMRQNDYHILGVDFESFNNKGAAFWNRHFTPYTFSLSRRIDERITSFSNGFYED